MKKIFLMSLLILGSFSVFANASRIELNNAEYYDAIIQGLEDAQALEYFTQDEYSSRITFQAAYAENLCGLNLEVKSHVLKIKASFMRKAKNLEQCKKHMSKFVKKNLKGEKLELSDYFGF
jgi:hypothetical protein